MGLIDISAPIHIQYLTYGDTYELQSYLEMLGYDIAIDGVYGQQTLSAFNQFKTDYKLTHPDLIGETTVKVLLEAVASEEAEDDRCRNSKPVEPCKPTTIDWTNFNSHVSKWFTVGEVSQWSNDRIVTSSTIQLEVLFLADELDKVREAYGKPIGVTSWYRPDHVNKAVGGASNSQHLYGRAADIYPIDGNIHSFQSWLDGKWYGALGYGANKGFVHCDTRGNKGFNSGGNKGVRWHY